MTLAKGISSGVLPCYTKYTPADQAGPLPNLFSQRDQINFSVVHTYLTPASRREEIPLMI